jgi:hypothetical protein
MQPAFAVCNQAAIYGKEVEAGTKDVQVAPYLYEGRRTFESISNRLSQFYKTHSCRVHAIAQTGWAGTIIKDMTKVRIAISA